MRVKRHNKTDASFSEPQRILRTVLIDNGSRWHMSKLKRCELAQDEPNMLLADDMKQAKDERGFDVVDP